jgi:hypothetical protein
MRKNILALIIITAILVTTVFASRPLFDPTGTRRLVGSMKSNVYHWDDCKFVKKINPDYLFYFANPETAAKMLYKPCMRCNPPVKSKPLRTEKIE